MWSYPTNDQGTLTFNGDSFHATAVAWNSNGERLVSGSDDGAMIIWDVATAQRLATMHEAAEINDIAWRADDRLIASISGANLVHIWDVSSLSTPSGVPTATYYPITNSNGVPLTPTPPTVTIEQANPSDPTFTAPIIFTVQFSESVVNFDAADVDLSASTAPDTLSATITGSDDIYTVAVSGMTGSGTIVASIPANAAQNWAGIGTMAPTSNDNSVTFQGLPTATATLTPSDTPTDTPTSAFLFGESHRRD